jgi:hypothetical protein
MIYFCSIYPFAVSVYLIHAAICSSKILVRLWLYMGRLANMMTQERFQNVSTKGFDSLEAFKELVEAKPFS